MSNPNLEEKVCAADVRRQLVRAGVQKGDGSVARLARVTGLSTRTIYRAIDARRREPWEIGTADRLLVGAGRRLADTRVVFPDGHVEPYA